jgi:hypothetical protein
MEGFKGRELIMDLKSPEGKVKARKRLKMDNHGCIACRHACSMSGLCMMPWPKSPVSGLKGDIDDDTDGKKNS